MPVRSAQIAPVKHDYSAGIVEYHGRLMGNMTGMYTLPRHDPTMKERFGKVDGQW
ncbi:MAG: hypothetical protein M1149_03510 [Candidatus Thermoplasmatota archaeon]|nr:hypothetical protein [Candidatus Thermoplasmatota archaeon]